jgi:hypothetical protein
MTDTPEDRAEALRREAAWCLEQAKAASSSARRGELIALAARFHDLANSVSAYSFGPLDNQAAEPRGPVVQQQQIQPKKPIEKA